MSGPIPTEHPPEHAEARKVDIRLWTLPASILAGSLLLVIFEPLVLLISFVALIWLALIHRSYMQRIEDQRHVASDAKMRTNQALELASQLRAVLNASDAPIVATDHEGVIVHVNQAARRLLGSGRSLIGDHFDLLIPERTIRDLEELARKGEPGHAKLQLPVGGDMRIFGIATEPLPSTSGSVCTFTDITELTRSATLKADFAANASHELRTPITSINAAIETLQGPAKGDAGMCEKLIGMIASNADRLDMMVRDLLDLSKLESTEIPTTIETIDLIEHIESIFVPFEQVCQRKNLKLEIQNKSALRLIRTDPSLLELILRNLIQNATKFSNEDTSITVRVEPMPIAIDPQNPPPEEVNGKMGLRIGVRDRGIGIPIAHQARVFERFYQVDDSRAGSSAIRGTGLGLAIVKHATRTLGASVRIESVHHQGTTVIIDLPRCVPGDAQVSPELSPDSAEES